MVTRLKSIVSLPACCRRRGVSAPVVVEDEDVVAGSPSKMLSSEVLRKMSLLAPPMASSKLITAPTLAGRHAVVESCCLFGGEIHQHRFA